MLRNTIKSHPVLLLFFLAYIISWGGILLSIGTQGFTFYRGEGVLSGEFSTQMLMAWVFMMAGPVLAAVILSILMDGRQ